jgi:prepilin-type processing-associated H-X9-DG protein
VDEKARQSALRFARTRLGEGRSPEEVVGSLKLGGWSEEDARSVVAEAQGQAPPDSGAVPPPPSPPPSQPQPSPGAPGTARRQGLAGFAFVLSLVSVVLFILAPIALLLSLLAMRRTDRRGLAIAGVAISGCMSVVALFIAPILAAFLLHASARARDDARSTSCVANLKSLAMAHQMYSLDNDGRLPDMSRWPGPILAYAKNQQECRCPSDQAPKQVPGVDWQPGNGLSYAASRTLSGQRLKAVAMPGEVPLLFDCDTPPQALPEQAALRHQGKTTANVAFADGHCKPLSQSGLLDTIRQAPKAPAAGAAPAAPPKAPSGPERASPPGGKRAG